MNRQEIILKIKEKKELSGISNKIIEEILDNYVKSNAINLSNIKERDVKLIIKFVRDKLRKLSGRFSRSAEERLEFYPELKSLIEKLKIKSILDLGCGQNPIYIAEKNITYYACDINESDLTKVREHFQKNKIKGKVFFCDLRKDNKFPKADICLILKVFDAIETKGHKLAEKILLSLNCKYILISFPTKTLSGRPMNHPQRGWIERLLTRLGYKFEIIKSKNEIYYLSQKG